MYGDPAANESDLADSSGAGDVDMDMGGVDVDGMGGEMVDMPTLAECLQTLGVSPVAANRFVASVLRSKPSLVEVYGRGSIMRMANGPSRDLNLLGV